MSSFFRRSGRRSLFGGICLGALVLVGCGGSSTSSTSAPTPTSAADPTTAPADPTATTAPTTAAEPAASAPTTISAASSQFLMPADPGYFDAVGAPAISFVGSTSTGGSIITQSTVDVDRDNNLYEKAEGLEEYETWFDGSFFLVVADDGQLRPSLTTGSRLPGFIQNGEFTFNLFSAPLDSAAVVGTTEYEGQPVTEYFVEGTEAVAAFENPDDGIELSDASQRALVNEGGAVLHLETIRTGTSEQIGNFVATNLLAVTAIDSVRPAPLERLVPDADDERARAILQVALDAEREALVGNDGSTAVPIEEIQTKLAEIWVPVPIEITTLDQADTDSIGYVDRVMVIESESGNWICGRGSLRTDSLRAVAATREEAATLCEF